MLRPLAPRAAPYPGWGTDGQTVTFAEPWRSGNDRADADRSRHVLRGGARWRSALPALPRYFSSTCRTLPWVRDRRPDCDVLLSPGAVVMTALTRTDRATSCAAELDGDLQN